MEVRRKCCLNSCVFSPHVYTPMYYHHTILLAQTAPEHVLPLLDKSLREVGESRYTATHHCCNCVSCLPHRLSTQLLSPAEQNLLPGHCSCMYVNVPSVALCSVAGSGSVGSVWSVSQSSILFGEPFPYWNDSFYV